MANVHSPRSDFGIGSTFPRHLQDQIGTLLRHFLCVVVNGVCQSGKITLLGNLPGDGQCGRKGRFVLSRSSSPGLTKNVAETLAGRSWEAYTGELLLRGFAAAGIQVVPCHFRTRSGGEVDRILTGEVGTLPVEINLGATTEPRSLRALTEFVAGHHCPLGLVSNNDERPRVLAERIVSVPAAAP